MRPSLLRILLILLIWPAQTWAAPSLESVVRDYGLYLAIGALSLALIGVGVGVLAARKRGFNAVLGALAGLVLGPLSPLLFLAPRREAATQEAQCPQCGEGIPAGRVSCASCGWDPERPVPQASPQKPASAAKGERKSASKRRARRMVEVDDDLSSEFAQYSEMLRKTLPGALDRPELIDYGQKFAQVAAVSDDSNRCCNPACDRLLPPPYEHCPHCGTKQTGAADPEMRKAG